MTTSEDLLREFLEQPVWAVVGASRDPSRYGYRVLTSLRKAGYRAYAVNPTADDLDLEADRFRQKVEAGARYAMTQIVFDLDVVDRFGELIGGWPIPVLVGIFPVTSHRLALRLHNEVPGIVVPDTLQQALADAGADAARLGMEHARELVEAARGRASGVYVVAPYRRPAAVLDLLG